jgi:type II secretory pathway predicted ATPase ExeA
MKIKDTLLRDPSLSLANQGQARIATVIDDKAMAALRYELSTFVCEGEYREGLSRLVTSYLTNLGKSDASQKALWVSGFYGSGKSHLLKMFAHLWQDTVFSDGATARSLVHDLPEEVSESLKELDVASRRSGGRMAASGTLLSGTTDNVRLTILSIILRAAGLPEQYAQARFCLWLRDQGKLDPVRKAVESEGKNFERELNNLFVSGSIAKAVIAAMPGFAATEADARQLFKAQFPLPQGDITTAEFIRVAKEALHHHSGNGKLPCTLLILDEAQQYIGDSHDRSALVTEVAEAVSKEFDGHLMVIAAGQSALTDVPQLQKLLDRFTIRPNLQDADVEAVTRKVLLQKKPAAVDAIRAMLDKHSGEISRQLNGTAIGEHASDNGTIVDDYPLLPTRRRFWEECFRQIDAAGTSSQLRSQLRIINDAIAKVADAALGQVIPADELFEALAPDMSTTGVLLREINERIIEVGKTEGPLARRICGLVFLIGKLKREKTADSGVRSTKEHIADLLIDNLNADNGKLRDDVEKTLKNLADRGVLMSVGTEYRLQTREGAEWDNEFRTRVQKIQGDDASIQFNRDRAIYGAVDATIRTVKVVQGAAKEARRFVTTRDEMPPTETGNDIPVWVHDGFSSSEKDFVDQARLAGVDSSILFVFIPRQHADDLRRAIVEEDAAKQTLEARGNPEGEEGKQARASMESRRTNAGDEKARLVAEITANAKVFQGGGSELLEITLFERIKNGADAALVRLFPRFGEADSSEWPKVIARAKDGSDLPFEPVGHKDAADKHPVCREVMTTIGSGTAGAEVRKTLRGSPYGWPQDAIDAAIVALHRSQHISAKLNGTAVAAGQLDQNKISKAEFRIEKATLDVKQRIRIRDLFSKLQIKCKNGEETSKAPEFLVALVALGRSAGGEQPLPAPPNIASIEDMSRLVGNEQLLAIHADADAIEGNVKTWQDTKALAERRLPQWRLLERLAKQGAGIAEIGSRNAEIEAIRSGRMLLAATDPVAPIIKAVAAVLRIEIQRSVQEHRSTVKDALTALSANSLWAKLELGAQNDLLAKYALVEPIAPSVGTDSDIADFLDRQSLGRLREITEAVPGKVDAILREAAKLLEPKVQYVIVPRDLLRNAPDVHGWIDQQRAKLLAAVANGPVQVN